MNKYARLFLFTTILLVGVVIAQILYLQEFSSPLVSHKRFTPEETVELIKTQENYQNDSITVSTDGILTSHDPLMQSVIVQMYIVEPNLASIRQEANNSCMPEAFVVYKTASYYFIQQYGNSNK